MILGCFCGARKWSISDGQIGPADGIDELAVLGKSLDSPGCSLSLDLLTETWWVLLAICWAVIDTWQANNHTHMSSYQIIMLTLWPRHSHHAFIVLYAWCLKLCLKLCPSNRCSHSVDWLGWRWPSCQFVQYLYLSCVGAKIPDYTKPFKRRQLAL